MQDDKPPLFDAHDLLGLSLAAMAGMVADLEFVPGTDARRRRRRPRHRDRPRRLAGGRGAGPVPRGAPHRRPRGRAGRGRGQGARRTDASTQLRTVDARIDERALPRLSVEARSRRASRLAGPRRSGYSEAIAAARAAIAEAGGFVTRRCKIIALALGLAACGQTAPLKPAARPVAAGAPADRARTRRASTSCSTLPPQAGAAAGRRIADQEPAAPGRPLRPAARRRRRAAGRGPDQHASARHHRARQCRGTAMTIRPVRKAIFPVAGLGTRLLPATKTHAQGNADGRRSAADPICGRRGARGGDRADDLRHRARQVEPGRLFRPRVRA